MGHHFQAKIQKSKSRMQKSEPEPRGCVSCLKKHFSAQIAFVAQRQSSRLLPGRLRVQGPPNAPFLDFAGSLAQSSRAPGCQPEGRGSKARTDRQFQRARGSKQSAWPGTRRYRSVTGVPDHLTCKMPTGVTGAQAALTRSVVGRSHGGQPSVKAEVRADGKALAYPHIFVFTLFADVP